jgi:glucan endo-1,6-beta-glucosidase
MATNIHTDSNFRNVGMLEIINEPIQNSNSVGTMRSTYYPNAFAVGVNLPPSNFSN